MAVQNAFSQAQDLVLMGLLKHAPRIQVGWNWTEEAESDMECRFTSLDSASILHEDDRPVLI